MRVTYYYLLHELRDKFAMPVTSYYLFHEFRGYFFIRATSFILYEFHFTSYLLHELRL